MNTDELPGVVIAGAGTMGTALAQIFAQHGLSVTLWNRSEKGIDRAKAVIQKNQISMVDSGRITGAESAKLTERIDAVTGEACFSSARFVLESIAEDLEIKQDFFRRISATVPKDCIIATNTSGLSITLLGTAVLHAGRFVGMHWINPPYLIPLVEIIRGGKTSEDTLNFVYDLAVRLGKKPIRAKDVPGFVLNRLQFAVLREALSLAESGAASPEDIDRAMKYGLGLRYACLGPFETADLAGLDVFTHIADYLFADLDNSAEVPKTLKALYDRGDWGVKSGRGFYNYTGGKAAKAVEKRDQNLIKITGALGRGKI
ncbi:3-hydroxyacyl-CoA dehydrogenase family protein [Caproiciproducens sp. NJN-50]|uniref:3-hydroxyacyl-CoA dehydrogenase family protein n=1 Tax=Acutalibacteraceae TaxID=3082771 RepID=UPI000FFE2A2E|nr:MULTISPECIES: 3-hydroxyacyl-CoA dehydrogenase family protein [Acutalibacteraceae]QAT49232.1 3-hydroxyacyl-CoA dehydrogenase family protein [Caproiciproducens sp. NJN-50]